MQKRRPSLEISDMEKAVLGAMLIDPLAIADATAGLSWGDFSLSSHQVIFRRISQMTERGESVDTMSLHAFISPAEMSAIGGMGYVSDLPSGLPRNFSVAGYVRKLSERSMARRAISACHDATAQLLDHSKGVPEVLDELTRALGEERREESVSAAEAMPAALSYLEGSDGRIISTGVRELDEFTGGGMRTKELWIIGALPSRGKSSLARQLERGALRAGSAVHTHTIEMPKEDWLLLHAAQVGGVPVWKLRQPRLMPPGDKTALRMGAATVEGWPLMLDDGGTVHMDTLLAKSRLSVMRHKTRVVVVDYLQLLNGEEKEMRHRMGTAAKKLKQFAKAYDCCVVALSQLARRGDINSRPTMQDLKESGDLEAAGDVILLNYMPVDTDGGTFTGSDEIIVAKQRNGGIGSIPMRYDSNSLTFRTR